MEILRFGPDDADRLAQYVDVTNAVRAVDSPWSHPATVKGMEGRFRYGWDGEVEIPFLGVEGGVPVATGTVATSEHDNLHLAWLGLAVHPEHRRRGLGTAMLEHLVAETTARGRTSIGTDGWESEATRGFADRHGLKEGSRAVQRRQVLADLDWAAIERMHGEATAAASAYELVR